MKYAVTDIGSNTIKVHFYSTDGAGGFVHDGSLSRPAKLIEYLDGGKLTEAGIRILCDTLLEFMEAAKDKGYERFLCFATASLRSADNSDDVIEHVRKHVGTEIHLISGREEAQLSLAGVRREIGKQANGILIDMGGGSTEAIAFTGDRITSLHSMPFGSLSLFRRFVTGILPDADAQAQIRDFVASELQKRHLPSSETLYIAGGTGRAICKIDAHLAERDPHGICRLPALPLYRLEQRLCVSADTEALLHKLVPEREKTLLPGLIAICTILRNTGGNSAVFVTYGVREGYLLSIL